MPTALVGAPAVKATATSDPAVHQAMVHGRVVGRDLGSKIAPIGSLATQLWLRVLHGKGVAIDWGLYLRTGLLLTPPMLLATLAALARRLGGSAAQSITVPDQTVRATPLDHVSLLRHASSSSRAGPAGGGRNP